MKRFLPLLLLFISIAGNAQNWVSYGPYTALAYEIKKTGDTLWVGTNDGLYYSMDNGHVWNAANGGFRTYAFCFAIHNNVIVAGTQNKGIYYSFNRGQTWSQTIDTLNGDVTFGELEYFNGKYYLISQSGKFYSSVDGISWTDQAALINNAMARYIEINQNNMYVTTGSGIYKSTDGGNSFNILSNVGVSHMAFGTNCIYAIASNGLLKSTDGGQNFSLIANSNNNMLSVAAEGTNVYYGLYAGGLKYSSNSGNSFTYWDQNTGANNVWSLATFNPGEVYAGTSTGVYKSTQAGQFWQEAFAGIHACDVRALCSNGSSRLFCGSYGLGINHSDNNGGQWVSDINSIQSYSVIAMAASGNNVVAGTLNTGTFYSTNNGSTYFQSSNAPAFSVWIAGNGSDFLLSDGSGLYHSSDGGQSFSNALPGLPSVVTRAFTNGSLSFASSYPTGLSKSTNFTTWGTTTGLENRFVNDIAFDNTTLYAATDSGLFKSTNNGDSWVSVHVVSLDIPLTTVDVLDGNIIVGTGGDGMYISANNGVNWNIYGLQTEQYITLSAVHNNKLFVACMSDGIWQIDDGLAVKVDGENQSVSLFPNPTNGNFKLAINSNYTTSYAVSVLNAVGQLITGQKVIATPGQTLIDFNTVLPAGLYYVRVTGDEKAITKKLIVN